MEKKIGNPKYKVRDEPGKRGQKVYVLADNRANPEPVPGDADSIRAEMAWEDEAITTTDEYFDKSQEKIITAGRANKEAVDDLAQHGTQSRYLAGDHSLANYDVAMGIITAAGIEKDISNHVYDSVDNVPARYLSSGREEQYNTELAAHLYSDESFNEFYDDLDDEKKNPMTTISGSGINLDINKNMIPAMIAYTYVEELENDDEGMHNKLLSNYVEEHHEYFTIYDYNNGDEISRYDENYDVYVSELHENSPEVVTERLSQSLVDHADSDEESDAILHNYLSEDEVKKVRDSFQSKHKKRIRESYERYVYQVTGIRNDD